MYSLGQIMMITPSAINRIADIMEFRLNLSNDSKSIYNLLIKTSESMTCVYFTRKKSKCHQLFHNYLIFYKKIYHYFH